MLVCRVYINAKYCVFYAKKKIWDAKNEMQYFPGMQNINRILWCKINFWWQKFCLNRAGNYHKDNLTQEWAKITEMPSRNLFRLSENSVLQSEACVIMKEEHTNLGRTRVKIKMAENRQKTLFGIIDLMRPLEFCLGALIKKRRGPWQSSWKFLLKSWVWLFSDLI